MTDLYLSAGDSAALPGLCGALPSDASVYVIGYWSERTGGTDDIPEMTPVPGYHVNVRLPAGVEIELPAGWTRHYPETPWCVWCDP
jgi:hypothetical protein